MRLPAGVSTLAVATALSSLSSGRVTARGSLCDAFNEASSVTANYPDFEDTVRAAYVRIVKRFGGTPQESALPAAAKPERSVDAAVTSALADRLLEISTMDPQARGHAFETFLKQVFDAYRLAARASFRLRGEQIDGTFVLAEQTYLLEARWRNAQVDVETLRAFNGKVEEKASGAREGVGPGTGRGARSASGTGLPPPPGELPGEGATDAVALSCRRKSLLLTISLPTA